ncbi:hypothetical protein ACFL5O_00220 [Myxococcota bacterium]
MHVRLPVTPALRIGIDENGLGARLGPMVVTGVLARVHTDGVGQLTEPVPGALARHLGDSKQLVSHRNVQLGEAWARVLVDSQCVCPNELWGKVSLDGTQELTAPCPSHLIAQCWSDQGEKFEAQSDLVERVRGHREDLAAQGIEIVAVRAVALCSKRLNLGSAQGHHRFVMDLHQMERLVLALHALAGTEVHAVCGKVGGIHDYCRFFGPLAGRLRTVLVRSSAISAYRFPGLGELSFVRDADARDRLVMLASLVGKYLRELLMSRIVRHYAQDLVEPVFPSGYHDPVTRRFVQASEWLRQRRAVPDTCFERLGRCVSTAGDGSRRVPVLPG